MFKWVKSGDAGGEKTEVRGGGFAGAKPARAPVSGKDEGRKKPVAIEKYSNHMLADTWMLTGDSVKFSDRELMRDGQNRNYASVKSGVGFWSHAVFGIPDDAFDLLDQGKNRSAADVLKINSVSNPEKVAAIARTLVRLDNGVPTSRTTVEPHVIRTKVESLDPVTLKNAVAIGKDVSRMYDRRWPISQVGALYYYLSRRSDDSLLVDRFFEAFRLGAVGHVKVLKKLNDTLADIQKHQMSRVHDTARFAMLIKAWNFHVLGRAGNKGQLRWRPNEDFPSITLT